MSSKLSKRIVTEMGGGGVNTWSEIIALAKLPGVTDLGQGWPDVASSKIAQTEASTTILDTTGSGRKRNQYSPIGGISSLKSSITAFNKRRYGIDLDAETEVCVSTSGTEALYACAQALCDPGDEVIVFEPFFPWYLPCVRLAGGIPKVITLHPPDFKIEEEKLREAFSSKTKLIIFNSPHNPTSHVASKAELELVAELCEKHDVVALSDEVYETVVYDDVKHIPLSKIGNMKQRTITVSSAGKIFNLTGWRIGWMTGPSELISGCRTMCGYMSFSPPTGLQEGIGKALDLETDSFYENIISEFKSNFDLLAKTLSSVGLEVCAAAGKTGGYFLVADVKSTGKSAMEYCRWLAKEKGVAAVPLDVFYAPRDRDWRCSLVRFAICKRHETIVEACTKILA
eukprot:m.8468 g.8468  ORF g.8468 m.8468 type:complete len:399 (+) comp3903_c0_seq1:114-1310(+)